MTECVQNFGEEISQKRLSPETGTESATRNCGPFLSLHLFFKQQMQGDRLCGLVVRVLGYRSEGPGSIPGTTIFSVGGGGKKTVVGLERGPLSLVSTTEELLDRKVAAPV
jgi:hypothetical protein